MRLEKQRGMIADRLESPFRSAWTALAVRVGLGCAMALILPNAAGQPRDFSEDGRIEGPEVEEAATVLNLLRTAEDAVNREDWKLAIDSLRRIVDEPRGLLMHSAMLYESPRRYANRRLATLPPAGVTAFRLLYDGRAKALLERARRDHDIAALQQLCDRYLPTRYGAEASSLLASWLIDVGREAEALVVLDDSLAILADGENPPAGIQHKRAVAMALLGDHVGARSLYADLPRDVQAFVDNVTSFVGTSLDQEKDWTGPGGGGTCHGNMTAIEPSFAEDLPWRRKIPGMYPDLWPLEHNNPSPNALPVSQAITADGRMFVLTGNGCMAIDLKSFAVMWTSRSAAKGIAARGRSIQSPNPTSSDSVLSDYIAGSLTTSHGLVFTIERGRSGSSFDPDGVAVINRRTRRPTPVDNRNRLVAYDAITGALRWQRGHDDDADPQMRQMRFLSPPVSDGRRLWVPFARGGDLFVGALEPTTGEWVKEILLCAMGGRDLSNSEALFPAVANEIVYIPSHHGLFFAIDTRDETVLWASRYRADRAPRNRRGRRRIERATPTEWLSGPPVVTGRSVLLAPADDDRFLVFDRFTGEVLWHLPRERHRYIIATDGAEVWLGGEDVSVVSLYEQSYMWTVDTPNATGRAVLSGHTIYVPTRTGLMAMDDLSGDIKAFHKLPSDQTPLGNLLCVGDSMVSVDPTEVRAFPDRHSYDATLAAHKHDPTEVRNAIRLAFMELLNDQPRRALDALRDVRVPDSADAESHRLHVAHLRVSSLLRLGRRPGADVDTAIEHLRQAVAFARDNRDQVAARLAMGDKLRRVGRFKDAYRTLWELGRGPLGNVPFKTGPVTRLVRLTVADTLRRIEPELSPSEIGELSTEAADLFGAAEASLSATDGPGAGVRALRALVDTTPLDGWDQAALNALGRFEAKRGKYERAEQYLTESVRRGSDRNRTAESLLTLMDMYLKPAQSLARSAAVLADRLRSEFAGVTLDGLDMVEHVRRREAELSEGLDAANAGAGPIQKFQFTGRQPYSPLAESGLKMVRSRWDRPESLAGRHLLLLHSRTLRAHDVADGALEWESDLLLLNDFAYQTDDADDARERDRDAIPLAVNDGQTAVLNGPKGLHAVGIISGNRLWAEETGGSEMHRDPMHRERMTSVGSGRVACMLSPGTLSVRRVLDGGLVWERTLENDPPVSFVAVRDDVVLTVDASLERVRVYRLDNGEALGELVFDQNDLELDQPIPIQYSRGLLCGPDGAGVAAYDVRTGERRWSLPLKDQLVGVFEPQDGRLVISTADGEHWLCDSESGEVLFNGRFDNFNFGAVDGVLEAGVLVLANSREVEAGVRWEMMGLDVATGRELWSRDVIGTLSGPNLRAAGGVIPIIEVLSLGDPGSERAGANRGNRTAVQRVVLIDKQTGSDLGEPYRWEPGPGQQLTGYLDVWPGRVLLQMAEGVAAIETVAIEGEPGGSNRVN